MATLEPADILAQLSKLQLTELAKYKKNLIPEKSTKTAMVDTLVDAIEEEAAKQFVAGLKLEELQDVHEVLDIDHGSNNPNSKSVLSKRLIEAIAEVGIESFLEENEKLVVSFAKLLEIPTKDVSDEKLTKSIVAEFKLLGTKSLFGKASLDFLQEACRSMKLKSSHTSRDVLIDEIVLQTSIAPAKKDKKKSTTKASKTKQPIKSGVTYEDLFQHYYLEELQDYCRDNDLKISGTKRMVIKRILESLEEDKEN